MSPERWREIEALLRSIRENGPAALASVDPEVRRYVEGLLPQASEGRIPGISAQSAGVDSTATIQQAGRRIGPYQIDTPLGAGGMGEVYRATDTRLGRSVAIKICREQFSKRFEREARAIAALNHPHVCTVYDVGPNFLVMELVEGETLSARLRRPLPLDVALDYAAEIADALAAAHAHGIVHRDLKPGNIMISRAGVKVLDFGLAKFVGREDAPGASEELTASHAIVGTLSYMAPEQLQGKAEDARCDIFSFGAVLYEMLTGRRAFSGDTSAAIMNAVLHTEPPAIHAANPDVPPELEKLVRSCLDKNPARRMQQIADVRSAIEELKKSRVSVSAATVKARSRKLVVVATGAGALVLTALAALIWWRVTPVAPLGAPQLTRLTSDAGVTTDPALSPDGRLLAYASDRSGDGNLDIYVRQVGGGDPIRLTQDPADDREPAFSPDGTTVAYRSERDGGGVFLVSTLGGSVRRIAAEGRRPRFSPDGKWIAYWVGRNGLDLNLLIRNSCRTYIIPVAGGAPVQIRPDFTGAATPVWTPDGTHLLFLGSPDDKFPGDNIDWWLTPLDGRPPVRSGVLAATRAAKLSGDQQALPQVIVPNSWNAAGNAILFTARSGDTVNSWQVPISPTKWKVAGPPQRLTSGPALESSPSAARGPNGTDRIAFASMNVNLDIYSLPVDMTRGKLTGNPQQLTRDSSDDLHPGLSLDGSRMVFISSRTGAQEIWVQDLRTGTAAALTTSRSINKYSPRFSPDASFVSYSSYENEKWNIQVTPVNGGTSQPVCENCGQATQWVDGDRLLGNSGLGHLWMSGIGGRQYTEILAMAGHWFGTPYLSSDRKWLAFIDQTRGETYIAPFDGQRSGKEDSWINVGPGQMTLWSRDGQWIYGRSRRDGYLCVWGQRLDPGTKRPIGPAIPIFHYHDARRPLYAAGPAGADKILTTVGERTGNIWMAEWEKK